MSTKQTSTLAGELPQPIRRLPYTYLTATSYSGSTLLGMLLDTHPEIVSIGELANEVGKIRQKSAYFCSCGSEISLCQFWIDVQHECRKLGVELDLYDFDLKFDLGRGRIANKLAFGVTAKFQLLQNLLDVLTDRIPAKKAAINKMRTRTATMVRAILQVSGKSRFFDTSKEIRRVMYLSSQPEFHTRVVHLVRDPRAVLYSFLRRKRQSSVDNIIKYWMRIHSNALRLRTQIDPENYVLVHYEAFCNEPDQTLDRICRFLDLPAYPMLANVNSYQHHVIGNEMRKKSIGEIRLDDEWRSKLSRSLVTRCLRRTGNLAEQLGYHVR